MVYQLVYASAATCDIDGAIVNQIAESSVRHNGPSGVTGMLLSVDGAFFQLLEGDRVTVDDTYRRIERDPRHRTPEILLRQSACHRLFPCWSMGVRMIDDMPENENMFELSREFVRYGLSSIEDRAVAALMRRFFSVAGAERCFG